MPRTATLLSVAAAVGLAGALWASGALAAAGGNGNGANKPDITITPSVQAPNLGKIVPGTTPTTYHVDAATGAITRTSGDAILLSAGMVTPPTVSINCKGGGCASGTVTITITPGASLSGRTVTATAFNVASLSGATFVTPPSGTSPMTFTISPVGINGTATFRLGLDSQIAASGPTGVATWSYSIQALVN